VNGCIIVHLGFEFDSIKMQVTLPPNKKQRAVDVVELLLSASSVSISALESTLGFLSHCCQVVTLGRPFWRQLFSLLSRFSEGRRFRKIRIPRAIKEDLRRWQRFLESWSAVSMIQPFRETQMSLQMQVVSKELEVYATGTFSPKRLHQGSIPNILIGRRCISFYMHSFFGMSHAG